ncbi:29330_t:CDS:2 [Gigaspora margarita]|uniref:29330_t:CDS:1 n=1 Tax=Gigaspora margarita TaxID=4874 RepID=A0ABM8W2L2_GIGMA|nr:29330_t:CDS:2 [Gigaspora margarita]
MDLTNKEGHDDRRAGVNEQKASPEQNSSGKILGCSCVILVVKLEYCREIPVISDVAISRIYANRLRIILIGTERTIS